MAGSVCAAAASAAAVTPSAISSVRFYLNGSLLGMSSSLTAPSYPWDTTTVSNKSYALSAVATDNYGNSATSSAIGVNVGNVILPVASPNSGGGGFVVGSGPLAPGYQVGVTATSSAEPPTATATPTGTMTSAPATPGQPPMLAHNRQLYDTSTDVRALQRFLNTHGFVIAQNGPGSPGEETSYFGIRTYRALEKFQAAQKLPITGYLGPLTRAAIAAD